MGMSLKQMEELAAQPEEETDETEERFEPTEEDTENFIEAIGLLEAALILMEGVIKVSGSGKKLNHHAQKELLDCALEITAFLDNFINLDDLDKKVDDGDKFTDLDSWKSDR